MIHVFTSDMPDFKKQKKEEPNKKNCLLDKISTLLIWSTVQQNKNV